MWCTNENKSSHPPLEHEHKLLDTVRSNPHCSMITNLFASHPVIHDPVHTPHLLIFLLLRSKLAFDVVVSDVVIGWLEQRSQERLDPFRSEQRWKH